MKHVILTLGLVAALAAPGLAAAECFADYKAKKDNPLRLHYGVVQLPDNACANRKAAERAVARRVGAGGWKLLTVISTFGPEGLKQREVSAGQYFLRF